MSDAIEAEESEADLREHLRRIDEEIKELRQELDRLREDRQDREDGPTATRLLEEQEAVIETLKRHRLELLERLGRPRTCSPTRICAAATGHRKRTPCITVSSHLSDRQKRVGSDRPDPRTERCGPASAEAPP